MLMVIVMVVIMLKVRAGGVVEQFYSAEFWSCGVAVAGVRTLA